jgi:RNA polymerase sigma-70 factor (ECF subfamily)
MDGDLLQEFQSGDERAFSRIYDMYYSRIWYYARYFVPDHEKARDITAESFVKLWQMRGKFDDLKKIRFFLEITTRNSCFNLLKYEKWEKEKLERFRIEQDTQINSELFSDLVEGELLRRVYAAIEQLSPQARLILKLSYVDGLKNPEIASRLDLSLQTVSNHKNRAFKVLRSLGLDKDADLALVVLLSCQTMVFYV